MCEGVVAKRYQRMFVRDADSQLVRLRLRDGTDFIGYYLGGCGGWRICTIRTR
jgi:hypothetical protein